MIALEIVIKTFVIITIMFIVSEMIFGDINEK